MNEDIIMQAFRKTVLKNALFNGEWKLNKEFIDSEKLDEADVKLQGKQQLIAGLSDKIIRDNPTAIKTFDQDGVFKYVCQLLVLKPEDLYHIVEAVVQTLPDDKIKAIKAGKSLIKPV